jgi:hypothetical protein
MHNVSQVTNDGVDLERFTDASHTLRRAYGI